VEGPQQPTCEIGYIYLAKLSRNRNKSMDIGVESHHRYGLTDVNTSVNKHLQGSTCKRGKILRRVTPKCTFLMSPKLLTSAISKHFQ
jgi:hypothetical protein